MAFYELPRIQEVILNKEEKTLPSHKLYREELNKLVISAEKKIN